MEDVSASFNAWNAAAAEAGVHEFSVDAAVEVEHSEAWSDHPDVTEGNVGEFTAPVSGNADTTKQGHDFVAESKPAVEAGVSQLPHAVDGVGIFRLSEHIFKLTLK